MSTLNRFYRFLCFPKIIFLLWTHWVHIFSTNGPFYLQQKISWSHEYLLHFNVPFGNVFYLQFTLLDVRIYYKLYTNASFLLFSNFNYYHSHLLLEYSNSCLSYIRKEVSNVIGMEIWLSNRVFRALAEDQTSLTSMHTWKFRSTCSPSSRVSDNLCDLCAHSHAHDREKDVHMQVYSTSL